MNSEIEKKIIEEVPADDSTSYGEKMFLYGLILALKPKVVFETGTHKGMTSLYILAALETNGEGFLHTCDPYQWGAAGNLAKFPNLANRAKYYPKRGDEVLKEFDGLIDFFFCDGFHSTKDVLEEIDAVLPKLAPVATIVFHDCWYGGEGVNEAVEARGLHTVWLPTKNAMRIYQKHPEKMTGPL